MYIAKDIIELVRERARIEDIIRKYVPSLKLKGRNYTGLCPFHREKTPSFTVSPDKQIFHCFGCHAGGNVFSFIERIERLDFAGSVKHIAEIVGIEIKEGEKREDSRFNEILKLNNAALKSYSISLKGAGGKPGYDYLIKRGVHPESIDEFNLGFAPDTWNFLTNQIKDANVDLNLAENIGLMSSTIKNEQKHWYDKFRNRVIFPIFDNGGRVVGFGGRTIADADPKYLNSPETEVFKKRTVLYAFHLAKTAIRETNRVIIVEGYLDVIACHQSGVKNVVAPLGTALTQQHLEQLARYAGEIILLFDADSAGLKAATRSLELSEHINVDVKIAMLPHGDPFDYIIQKGIREFMSIVDSAQKPVDFKIGRIMADLPSLGNKNAMLQIFAVIRGIDLETERGAYLKKISSLLNLDENAVRIDFKNFSSRVTSKAGGTMTFSSDEKKVSAGSKEDYITRGYQDLIKLICSYPELLSKAVLDFSADDIIDEATRRVFGKMVEIFNSHEEFSCDKMFDFFPEGNEMKILNDSIHSEFDFPNPNSVYTELFVNMKIFQIESKINRYIDLIKTKNDPNAQKYITEIEVLTREKQKLSQYIYNKNLS